MIRELSGEEEWASFFLLGIVPGTVHKISSQSHSCKMEWSLESDTKVHYFFFLINRVMLYPEKVCKSLSNLSRGFSLAFLDLLTLSDWQFWAEQGYNAR